MLSVVLGSSTHRDEGTKSLKCRAVFRGYERDLFRAHVEYYSPVLPCQAVREPYHTATNSKFVLSSQIYDPKGTEETYDSAV